VVFPFTVDEHEWRVTEYVGNRWSATTDGDGAFSSGVSGGR
jgi:hypothetical protein